MGSIGCWCVCDRARLEGKYANKGASREREVSLTRGRRTKWEKEKKVHLDVIEKLQKIQKFEGRPIKVEALPMTWNWPSCLLS